MILLLTTVPHANPSAVIPLPGASDMVLNKADRPAPIPDGSDEPPEVFADRVRIIFPKGATSRLARAVDVNPRLAQRWMTGTNDVPDDVIAYVEGQVSLLQGAGISGQLKAMVEALQARGLDGEVIASQIAAEYEALIGREIE